MTNWGGPPDSDEKKRGLLGARMNEGKITSFGPSRAKQNEQLLANLSQGGQPGQTGQPAAGRSPGVEHTLSEGDPQANMVGWVDYLFDCLAKCEYDWNRSIDKPEMKVLVERPERITSGPPGLMVEKQVLKGRLTMHGWSMFVRATPDSIESYVMPSDRAISFTVNPGQFSRLFQINAGERAGRFGWFLDNRPVAWDDISDLAKELMEALIKIASGEANLEEPFVFLASSQPAMAPSPFLSEPSPFTAAPDSGPIRQHSAILGGLDSASPAAAPGARPNGPASHPQVILPSAAPGAAPQQPGAAQQQSGAAQQQSGAAQQQPAAGQQLPAAEQAPPELLKPVLPQPKPAPPAPKQVTLDQGFDLTIAAIDNELKSLSDQGSKAFAQQDTSGAERVLRRTEKIKGLRAEMVSTFLRWKANFNE